MGQINKLVSIVIPVFNREKLICETIQSVLEQTYKNWELIIVDDGSTDNTLNIIKEYAKKDIRIKIIEKEHGGSTDTMNRGLKEITGDIFCLLGSDDIWSPYKLERQMKCHISYPDYVLHSDALLLFNDGHKEVSNGLFDGTQEEYIKRATEPIGFFFGSSLFIPIDILKTVGEFKTYCNDYYWVIKAILKNNIKFKLVPGVLMIKRLNIEGQAYTASKEMLLSIAKEIRTQFIEERNEKNIIS